MSQHAARIRQARKAAGLSQAALAAHLGLDRRAVSLWEREDATIPGMDQLVAIALATGAALEWLATGRGPRAARSHGLAPTAMAMDLMAQTESEQRLLVAFRSLSALARAPMVDMLEARAKAR